MAIKEGFLPRTRCARLSAPEETIPVVLIRRTLPVRGLGQEPVNDFQSYPLGIVNNTGHPSTIHRADQPRTTGSPLVCRCYPNTPTRDYPKDHFKADIGPTGLLADARILFSQTFVYLGVEGRNDYLTGDLNRWILGDSTTKAWGMGHKRLLRDAALYPGAYEIFSDYRAKMIKEFKLGFVGAPSDKEDYEWYLAARGLSRSAYEM